MRGDLSGIFNVMLMMMEMVIRRWVSTEQSPKCEVFPSWSRQTGNLLLSAPCSMMGEVEDGEGVGGVTKYYCGMWEGHLDTE